MICPLMSYQNEVNTGNNCVEDDCALYDPHTGECSILSLERTLRYMESGRRASEDNDLMR